MNWLKNYLQDFPTHPATVFIGLIVFLVTGLVVAVKLAAGQEFPGGYDVWIGALIGTVGISTAGGIGKRATDINLALAKRGIVSTPPAEAAPDHPAPPESPTPPKTDGI